MPSKGFLIRGTLRPAMGSSTGMARNPAAATTGTYRPTMPQKNRIPPSITVKRNPGQR